MFDQTKQTVIGRVFQRYIRWRLDEFVSPETAVLLDYPIRPEPRYGEGKAAHLELEAMIAEGGEHFYETLRSFARFTGALAAVPERQADARAGDPYWDNGYFTGLDAIALYSLLGLRRPNRYVEVGSGNSTRFARKAVRDLGLDTEITSIDPDPRVEIGDLCDRQVRKPLEDAGSVEFERLDEGDVLFIDNSHRCFQNSDVTVFFLEILPRLRPGVLLHIHDIFLPYDYPSAWAKRYYSEQYLLAVWLLAGGGRLRVELPVAYCGVDLNLRSVISDQWTAPVFQRAFQANRAMAGGYLGTSFWCRTP